MLEVFNQRVCAVTQHLHKKQVGTASEDGGELLMARGRMLFKQGRVGGDAFEDAEVAVVFDVGQTGGIEEHGRVSVVGIAAIVEPHLTSLPT